MTHGHCNPFMSRCHNCPSCHWFYSSHLFSLVPRVGAGITLLERSRRQSIREAVQKDDAMFACSRGEICTAIVGREESTAALTASATNNTDAYDPNRPEVASFRVAIAAAAASALTMPMETIELDQHEDLAAYDVREQTSHAGDASSQQPLRSMTIHQEARVSQEGGLPAYSLPLSTHILEPSSPVSGIQRFRDDSMAVFQTCALPAASNGILAAPFSAALASTVPVARAVPITCAFAAVPTSWYFGHRQANSVGKEAALHTASLIWPSAKLHGVPQFCHNPHVDTISLSAIDEEASCTPANTRSADETDDVATVSASFLASTRTQYEAAAAAFEPLTAENVEAKMLEFNNILENVCGSSHLHLIIVMASAC